MSSSVGDLDVDVLRPACGSGRVERCTLAMATEWWRSLTRRKRILSFSPLMFSSMKSDSRESKTVLK